MAFSEYVLLVSLSGGIHAHGDAGGTSIGADAITQPNGGATRVAAQVDFFHKGLNAKMDESPKETLKTNSVSSFSSGTHHGATSVKSVSPALGLPAQGSLPSK